MKTKLLLLLLVCSSVSFAQTISSFTSIPSTNFTIMGSQSTIDQTASGMNSVWTFNNLTALGTNIDTYAAPTAGQLTAYPGTTEVLSITAQGGTPNVSDFFLKEDGNGTSITGASQGDVLLNYIGSNAFVGLFPLSFGTNNSNPVSGTFSYQGANGTFTGTTTTAVDAYGTLNIINSDGGSFSTNATRLRIDQTLSLSIPPIFNNIGTVTQTTYYYYDNSVNNIVFRYNNANVNSGFLGVNETIETLESTTNFTLSTDGFENSTPLKLYPNPVQNALNLKIDTNDNIDSITITDNLGRIVFTSNKNVNRIDVSDLNSGLYIVSIVTKSGKLLSQKVIKE
ncbi:T9SS type A sorting domain-containing protein [Lacinutrix jangbogonensis]|uniref:T9SS type A sorting domain-containing protein n=1 Tax=Lacinutrix jangbogonensis TaxID=1469557 RepID=UPI0009DDAF23|nr:T9SS type A sorting domain-containing protein [Lacinutrix jangbogonensis]